MTNLLREKHKKRLLFSKPVLIVLFIILFFVSRAAWNMYEKASIAQANVAIAEEELFEVEERYHEIQQRLEGLNTRQGLEAEIRNTYGLAREGEHVVIIVEDTQTSTSTESIQKRSIWQKIKSVF